MKRIIVCGCRDWADFGAVTLALTGCATGDDVTVVHGACDTGADAIADRWCRLRNEHWPSRPITIERHPADWSRGRRAGPERNDRMARLGADLCVAFWDGKSRGTLDMISRAVACGIPVRIVPRGAFHLPAHTVRQGSTDNSAGGPER